MNFATVPVLVLDKDGAPILFDMYIDGKWIGSRRTLAQCELARQFEERSRED